MLLLFRHKNKPDYLAIFCTIRMNQPEDREEIVASCARLPRRSTRSCQTTVSEGGQPCSTPQNALLLSPTNDGTSLRVPARSGDDRWTRANRALVCMACCIPPSGRRMPARTCRDSPYTPDRRFLNLIDSTFVRLDFTTDVWCRGCPFVRYDPPLRRSDSERRADTL